VAGRAAPADPAAEGPEPSGHPQQDQDFWPFDAAEQHQMARNVDHARLRPAPAQVRAGAGGCPAAWHQPLLNVPGEHDNGLPLPGLPVPGFLLLIVATSVLITGWSTPPPATSSSPRSSTPRSAPRTPAPAW
jgi:hypothetical protein